VINDISIYHVLIDKATHSN